MATLAYPGRNVVMPLGTSQTLGSQSTAAIQTAGYRWLLQNLSIAAGKSITFVGSQLNGSFTNSQHEGYSGQTAATVQSNSLAPRTAMQPEGVILEVGTVDFVGGSTAAQVSTATTTILNDIWDRQGHIVPGGGSTLRWVIVTEVVRYPTDLVTINPRIIDFDTNFLPPIIAAQRALGRDVISIPTYTGVNIGADLVHPDDTGYNQWANLIMTAAASRLRAAG